MSDWLIHMPLPEKVYMLQTVDLCKKRTAGAVRRHVWSPSTAQDAMHVWNGDL